MRVEVVPATYCLMGRLGNRADTIAGREPNTGELRKHCSATTNADAVVLYMAQSR